MELTLSYHWHTFDSYDSMLFFPNLQDSCQDLYDQLLMAYAGPASHVRVEHASLNIFNDGGAFAEVMSLYEEMDDINLADDENQQSTDVMGGEKYHSAIEVWQFF